MSNIDTVRADARANRDRILDVARDAPAADPAASLNSIARVAGVGAGTLYRHFPNRESLVIAVYQKEIHSLVALAPVLLAKHPPLQAFRSWCDRLAKFGKMKFGVVDIVHAATAHQSPQDTFALMLGAVRQLMDASEEAGAINPGANTRLRLFAQR